jgi:hypothetical protein
LSSTTNNRIFGYLQSSAHSHGTIQGIAQGSAGLANRSVRLV